jgi:hypothetical protein
MRQGLDYKRYLDALEWKLIRMRDAAVEDSRAAVTAEETIAVATRMSTSLYHLVSDIEAFRNWRKVEEAVHGLDKFAPEKSDE